MKNKIIRIIISLLICVSVSFIKTEILWIKPVLFIISYLIVGFDVIKEAIERFLKKDFFNENLLMSIATIGALAIEEFPEAVAVMIFYNIGEIFEEFGEERSKKSIIELMNIRPDYANLKLEDEKIKKVDPKKIKIGDLIIVKPGEKIPENMQVFAANVYGLKNTFDFAGYGENSKQAVINMAKDLKKYQ